MAYQALYRKWRPMTFNDVIGQSHIVNTLKNEVVQGRTAASDLLSCYRELMNFAVAKSSFNCSAKNWN